MALGSRALNHGLRTPLWLFVRNVPGPIFLKSIRTVPSMRMRIHIVDNFDTLTLRLLVGISSVGFFCYILTNVHSCGKSVCQHQLFSRDVCPRRGRVALFCSWRQSNQIPSASAPLSPFLRPLRVYRSPRQLYFPNTLCRHPAPSLPCVAIFRLSASKRSLRLIQIEI